MMRVRFFLLFIFITVCISAQNIKVSLLGSKDIKSLTVSIKQGKYVLKRGNETMGEYKRGSVFSIILFGNTIEVRDKKNFIGNFQTIEFESLDNEGILGINPVNPSMEAREYDDNLGISIAKDRLKLVNKVDLEKYLAAVIEAEGGNNAPLEYYKAQAVLIRTFTIKNLFKHAEEGFDLCDEVHCQAYKNRCSQHPEIIKATTTTPGIVLIDREGILIMSPFHSNCGGRTCESGLVWQKNLPYLTSVRDPFCTTSSQARWSKSVTHAEWSRFLAAYTKSDIDYQRYNFSFNLSERSKFIQIHGVELNLRTVREYFGLKSAYFSIEDQGDSLHFKGKGYGHGVGMCQQGAMEMARVGYTWRDIIDFYFHNVQVVDYREMELHRYKPE